MKTTDWVTLYQEEQRKLREHHISPSTELLSYDTQAKVIQAKKIDVRDLTYFQDKGWKVNIS